ncbi:MAG: HD domain-containing protein [Nanoarchaeota archaeon]|nr:HD domain-containing protein [Nanoarchaeota archaeon]
MNLESKASKFATQAHEGQLRKDGKTPYITHCAGVVSLLKEIGIDDEDTLCAAWLHDTIEDCGVTREYIKREFNTNIARIVSQLTRDVDREAYKERIKNADYQVQIVKLADTVHNCSTMTHPRVSKETIRRKLEDCKDLYFDLAKEVCLEFYLMLKIHTEGVK